MSIEFLVINITEERRSILQKQFAELKIPFGIKYMEATTPANAGSYLPANCNATRAKIICCARSHIRAIEMAGSRSAAEFTIIMEDDVSIHRTAFVPMVKELAKRWTTLMKEKDSNMISLGWIPCKNYETYLSAKSLTTFASKSDAKFLRDRFAPGLQAYMVRRDSVKNLSQPLVHDTFDAFYKYFKANPIQLLDPSTDGASTLEPIDILVPRYLLQTIVFPPLVIELPLRSMLEHDNQTLYWTPFFKGHEALREEYWHDAS